MPENNHRILSINGLRFKNGNLVYPNARVHVPAPEHAFWTDEARIAAAPAGMQGAFAGVKRALNGLTSDQLVKFEPGSTVAPGIQSVAEMRTLIGLSAGHTARKAVNTSSG